VEPKIRKVEIRIPEHTYGKLLEIVVNREWSLNTVIKAALAGYVEDRT
jgi:hypothetical protein